MYLGEGNSPENEKKKVLIRTICNEMVRKSVKFRKTAQSTTENTKII